MRPVTVLKRVYEAPGKWIVSDDYVGKFHGWGMELWEHADGGVAHSVAIVERECGTVELVPPMCIRFGDVEKRRCSMKHVYHFCASQYKVGQIQSVTQGLVERTKKVLTPDDYAAVLAHIAEDLDKNTETVITSLSYLGVRDE